MALELVEAQQDVSRHDYAAAEVRLKRILEPGCPQAS
jgi:hypothetical protein